VEKGDSPAASISSPTAATKQDDGSVAGTPYVQKTDDATDGGVVVDPAGHSAFDALLHRNNRFWEAVAAKKVNDNVSCCVAVQALGMEGVA
jgi:hypothetical protein